MAQRSPRRPRPGERLPVFVVFRSTLAHQQQEREEGEIVNEMNDDQRLTVALGFGAMLVYAIIGTAAYFEGASVNGHVLTGFAATYYVLQVPGNITMAGSLIFGWITSRILG